MVYFLTGLAIGLSTAVIILTWAHMQSAQNHPLYRQNEINMMNKEVR